MPMAHILCLFEHQAAIKQLRAELGGKHNLVFVTDVETAIGMLQDHNYDLFVCSSFLRAHTVVGLLHRLNWLGLMNKTKTVCIRSDTSPSAVSSDKLLKMAALSMGAADYMSLEKFVSTHDYVLRAGCD